MFIFRLYIRLDVGLIYKARHGHIQKRRQFQAIDTDHSFRLFYALKYPWCTATLLRSIRHIDPNQSMDDTKRGRMLTC